jgi:hypothetical protein
MFHKNISFYREYLKSRIETSLYLLPLDAIPPERLKDDLTYCIADFIFSIPVVSVRSSMIGDAVYYDLYCMDANYNSRFLASAYPLHFDFITEDADIFYFKFDDRFFAYVDFNRSNRVVMYEISGKLGYWVESAYNDCLPEKQRSGNINFPKAVFPLKIEFERPINSIDGLYQDDQGANDRRGKDV